MSHTGVRSTGSRRSARSRRSFWRGAVTWISSGGMRGGRWARSGARCFGALHEHQLEAFLQLQVARVLERGEGAALVEVLLAPDRAAAADLARLAHERPAAEQVGLELQLDEARGLATGRSFLQEQAHGAWIVAPAGVT